MPTEKQHKKTLLVVGYSESPQIAYQINYFKNQGGRVIILDHSLNQGCLEALQWRSNNQLSWQDEDISPSSLSGVLVCNRAPEVPIEEDFLQNPDARLNWDEWYLSFCLQKDRSDTLLGLLLTYEQMGLSMINPTSHSLLSCRKPYQLHIMRQAGCPLPETLVSNDPEATRQFILSHKETIVKPAAGGALTLSAQELLKDNRLQQLRKVPAIFQQRIFGDDIRVVVVDGEIISSTIIGVPEGTIDFRGNHSYQHGLTQYKPINLPEAIQRHCINAAQALGLRFTGIDIKRTSEHQFFFLECNSSPIYLDIELKTGHPITAALYESLTQRPLEQVST